MEFQGKEIKRGYWLYDGLIKKGVIINAINYDYWFEMEKANGFDMTDEEPELNENGEMYIIYWTDDLFKTIRSNTDGTLELQSTIDKAEAIVEQKINWLDNN